MLDCRKISYDLFSRHSPTVLAARGASDGTLSVPIPHAKTAAFGPEEEELRMVGQRDLNGLARSWHIAEAPFLRKLAVAECAVKHAVLAHTTATIAADKAEALYNEKYGTPAPATYLIKLGIAAFSFVAVATELPLSIAGFNQLHSNAPETAVMAFGVSATLTTCAHYVGVAVRKRSRFAAAIGAISGCSIAAGLAYLRYTYLTSLPDTHVTGVTLAAFLSFQLGIFAVAGIGSYFSHNESLTNVFRRRNDLRRAQRRLEKAESMYASIDSRAAACLAEYLAHGEQIIAEVYRRICIYRSENYRTRSDREASCYAPWHGRYPELTLPASLSRSTWNECASSIPAAQIINDVQQASASHGHYARRPRAQFTRIKKAGLVRRAKRIDG